MLKGRQSISCANTVFPEYIGGPSPERVQEAAANFKSTPPKIAEKTILYQMLPDSSFAVNRTVVMRDLSLRRAECVYVGDNLTKDVAMAIDCAVEDVWAQYGQAHTRPEYRLLQDVTHWTPMDVEREQKIRAREHVHPTHTLRSAFSEILEIFDFAEK